MNKIIKFCSFAFILLGLTFLASCSKNDIVGYLEVETNRNEIIVTAEFDRSSQLEDGTAKPYVSLYDEEDNYKSKQTITFEKNIYTSAKVTFTSLEKNTVYTVKLFVTVNGTVYELKSLETKTLDIGDDGENPIFISSYSELTAMPNAVSAHYKLTADIDANGATLPAMFTSNKKFTGTLDGANFKIKNLKLTSNTYMGLIGFASNAKLKNLVLEGIDADLSNGRGETYLGALVGRADNTTIENVKINGMTIKYRGFTSAIGAIGGLGGYLSNTDVKNCTVDSADIRIERCRLKISSGLFAGLTEGRTSIENCHSKGSLSATIYYHSNQGYAYLGGFIGSNNAVNKIVSCSAIVDMTITEDPDKSGSLAEDHVVAVGGFIGGNYQGSCRIEDALAIADIIITSKYATNAYIGGFAGKVTDKGFKQLSIENACYLPKDKGIELICNPDPVEEEEAEKTETTEETKKVKSVFASLVFGECKVTPDKNNVDYTMDSIIKNVFAFKSKITAVEGFSIGSANISTDISKLSEELKVLALDHMKAASESTN